MISAVGHEIDFTIADFVADRRAPTPTAAAEMVVPKKADLLEHLASWSSRCCADGAQDRKRARDNWRDLVKRLSDPGRKFREHQQRLDELSVDLCAAFRTGLRQWRDESGAGDGRLEALSPLAVLQRGYSIAHKSAGGADRQRCGHSQSR